jgi:hypothetical protein
VQCGSAIVESDAVPCSAEVGKGFFEGGDRRAEDELSIAHECSEVLLQFVPDG